MALVRNIVNVIAAAALAALFVAAGFAACLAPPVTHGLSSVFARDDISPLDRNQLVRVADATREYSFGSHEQLVLYQVIYDVDMEYRSSVGYSAASTTSVGFPQLYRVTDRNSVPQLKSAFAGASELYCFSEDTISHLDDCYGIMRMAFPSVIALGLAATIAIVFTGVTGGRRRVGAAFLGAGICVFVVFVGLGVWAIVDFGGFFTAFHRLLFAGGNWTFPYDSLLICSLPTEFWMSMGVLCLVVACVLSIASIFLGRRLRRS